ncbi:unnamed protein product [Paramecium pentaurelia]|uniref:Uncharacterized protein n=1 Tax=Paramecium pentaurelia TaxID=43138 RepID=A0A8S1X0R7_9CILI|nr:unnamed protein product [Paramecium pentaurelia]
MEIQRQLIFIKFFYQWIYSIYQGWVNSKNVFLLSYNIQPREKQSYTSSSTIRNLEQLKYLIWQGQYGNENQRIGRWRAYWRGEGLNIGGYYDDKGKKQGIWIELFENYWDKCPVTYQGEYQNGCKRGIWSTFYMVQKIGGGLYNENELKNGKWIDLHENFNNTLQVIYQGEYLNGRKIGIWNIHSQQKLYGIGYYDENGNKNGKWITMSFYNLESGQSIEAGQYKNDKQVGRWNVIQNNNLIGGGVYDENGIKKGMWIELDQNDSEVGEYINGKKVGMWDIIFRNSITGGGQYNEQGEKQGKWMELNENYNNYCQVIYVGEYERGIRNSKWKTIFEKKMIGEGQYNSLGMKQGLWVDLYDNFDYFCQVVHVGKYLDNQRYGQWQTVQLNMDMIIGGGLYDENGMKNGYWIDLFENYQDVCQIVYIGQYKNGLKYGKWITQANNQYNAQEIGGGCYDNDGQKQGKWIEIHENCSGYYQIILVGEYKDGIKQGRWRTQYKETDGYFYKTIGGGQYNEIGLKNGNWIELDNKFTEDQIIVHSCEYQLGKQILGLK